MKISPENAMTRALYGTERYEKLEFQVKVAEQFDKIFEGLDYCIEIDGLKDQKSISEEIRQVIERLNINKPLGVLW